MFFKRDSISKCSASFSGLKGMYVSQFLIRQVKTNATGGFPNKSCSQKLEGIKNICEISPFNILVSPSHFLLFPYAKMSNQICKKSDKNGREIYQKSDQGTHFVSLSGGEQVQLERKCSFSYFSQKCLQIFHPSFCSKPGEKHKNLHIAKIYTLH